jgi:heme-degrading monooxygenase HmoA
MKTRDCYAVIFSSTQSSDTEGYDATAQRMNELAAQQPGYLGIESTRGANGFGITVSYWESLEAIRAWKANTEHLVAQKNGRERWYASYNLRVCRVEYEYGQPATGDPP